MKKRRVGRPRTCEDGHTSLTMRTDLIKRIDTEAEIYSEGLGFKVNRQQFIEVLLNKWGENNE